MARALVAGPITLAPLSPDETLSDYDVSGVAACTWYEQVGLLMEAKHSSHLTLLGALSSAFISILPDGKMFPIGWRANNWLNGMGWSAVHNRPFVTNGISPTAGYALDFPTTNIVASYSGALLDGRSALHVPGRLLVFVGGSLFRYVLTGSSWAAGSVIHASYDVDGQGNRWAYAGKNQLGHHTVWLAEATTGQLDLYDVDALSFDATKRSSFGSAFATYGYSKKHDLFFVLRTASGTKRLYVYANEPAASAVSTPVFSSTPKKGGTYQLSATVTGSNAEPCPGRVVQFGVTVGTLSAQYVTTNASGVATTTYYAPTSTAAAQTATATLVE